MNTNITTECPKNHLINPSNEYQKIKGESLRKGSYDRNDSEKNFGNTNINAETANNPSNSNFKKEAIQLYPQEIKLKLRKSKLIISVILLQFKSNAHVYLILNFFT